MMRGNSGKDESRDNMRDPTIRSRTGTKRSHASRAKAPADHRGGRKD
jgi:hypothetical protein